MQTLMGCRDGSDDEGGDNIDGFGEEDDVEVGTKYALAASP